MPPLCSFFFPLSFFAKIIPNNILHCATHSIILKRFFGGESKSQKSDGYMEGRKETCLSLLVRFLNFHGKYKSIPNNFSCCSYRLATVNSKSFVSKVLLRIKWNFELTVFELTVPDLYHLKLAKTFILTMMHEQILNTTHTLLCL